MKYQVGIYYTWEGEFSVEADSEEEARAIVLEDTFSDPWENSAGTHSVEINEVYEWDEAAQERNRKEIEELFKKFPLGNNLPNP